MTKTKTAVESMRKPSGRRNGANGEQASRRSEERYRTLFDLVPVAVYACDANGVILEFNRRAAELWGRKPNTNGIEERFCGSYRSYYPDGRPMPRDKCPMARVLRGEKITSKDLEVVIERPNGERRHVTPAPKIFTNAQGEIVGAINCLYDITEQKRTEEQLLELTRLLDLTYDAIIVRDMDDRILYWNKGAEQLYGYTRKRALGRVLPELLKTKRPEPLPRILEALHRDKRWEGELVHYRSDGKRLTTFSRWSLDTDANGRPRAILETNNDVTARKKAELTLREKEAELELIVTQTPFMLTRCTRDFRYRYVSRAYAKMVGCKPEEIAGKTIAQIMGDKALATIRPYLERVLSGETVTYEAIVPFLNQSRFLHGVYVPDRNERGEIIGWIASLIDITERKEAEDALIESARQQQALYQFVRRRGAAESLPEIYSIALDTILETLRCDRASILLFDEKREMRFVDWRGLSGAYRKAVEGHSPWKANAKNPQPVCISDVDLAEIPGALKKAITREGIRAAAFIPLISERKLIGKFVAYYNRPHIFSDEELGLALNIGGQLALGIERKRAEAGLRESEERLRAIVEQATAGMARSDLSGRLLFVNQKFCEMLGYEEAELLGKRIRELTYSVDVKKTSSLFARLIKEAKPYEVEKRYVRKDGSLVWVSVSASPIRDVKGKIKSALAVVVDITARKKAESALRRSTQLLEKLVEHRTKALRVANAELESEITRRKGLESQILEISDREQQRLGQELHDGLCQQLTATAFMARAASLRLKHHRVVEVEELEKIARLINASVTDARNIARDLHKEEIDAAGFETALRDLAERKIWKTPCRLKLDGELDIEDDTVASQLYRILREGIINANKHARATDIVLEVCRKKNYLLFSVTDNGIGLDHKRKTSHGLGFRIMQYRAESIGAWLELQSSKNRGTRLLCYLPQ